MTTASPTPGSTTTAGSTSSVRSAFAELAPPRFANTLRSEWSKLWTTKAPRRNLILGTVLGIGLSALMALAVGSTFSDWNAADQAEFDPVAFSFVGSILTAIFFVAVGGRVATSEYDSGMIGLTLTATPKRHRVLLAKVLVVCVATWAFGAIAIGGMVVACQAVFGVYDMSTVSVFDAEVLRTLALLVLSLPLFPVLAVLAGIVFRGTAPTITVVLLLLFFPSFFGGLFPRAWQENFFSLFPGSAVDAVTIGHISDSPLYLDTAPALVVVAAWIILPLVGANAVLQRRDA